MIDLSELKPVLEEVIKEREDAAEIIDKIQALDTHSSEADIESAVAAKDAEWRERYTKTFFNGTQEPAPQEPQEPQEPEEDEEDETYEGLFE